MCKTLRSKCGRTTEMLSESARGSKFLLEREYRSLQERMAETDMTVHVTLLDQSHVVSAGAMADTLRLESRLSFLGKRIPP